MDLLDFSHRSTVASSSCPESLKAVTSMLVSAGSSWILGDGDLDVEDGAEPRDVEGWRSWPSGSGPPLSQRRIRVERSASGPYPGRKMNKCPAAFRPTFLASTRPACSALKTRVFMRRLWATVALDWMWEGLEASYLAFSTSTLLTVGGRRRYVSQYAFPCASVCRAGSKGCRGRFG